MDWLNQNILSILIFLPLVGALLLALLPRRVSREGAIAIGLANFVLSLHLWYHWAATMPAASGYRFEETRDWLPRFNISYAVGVDGISLFLILLTTLLVPLVLLFSWSSITSRAKEFGVCLLLLEGAIVGTFSALDLILFYIFFEAVLVPIYLMMVIWGGPRRVYASIKFLLYTMVGSVLMWVGLLYVYFAGNATSFGLEHMTRAAMKLDDGQTGVAVWLFAAFALAFAIKSPLFPFHTWQADAYSEAPTGATVMLAAVLAKMGTYGFIRFAIPFFPFAAKAVAPVMITLAIIGIVYGAMVAIKQTDYKRLLAFSSLSHMGFVLLGIFVSLMVGEKQEGYASIAMSGATLQMVNHGITTAALFLLVGMLYERRHTRDIDQFGGLAETMPRFNVLFWIALFASIGVPGLNGFVGEYLILQGTMAVGIWYAFIATTGVILGAVYMLRMFRSMMFGEITIEENKTLKDVNHRESFVVGVLLAVAVFIGVLPNTLLGIINPDAKKAATQAQQGGVRNAAMLTTPVDGSKIVKLDTP